LCKKIVTNHHGEIVAISKENEGALFKIMLPLNAIKNATR
jgi:signal transduction histidine kinase